MSQLCFCLPSCVFCYELNILMTNLHIQSSIAMTQNKLTNSKNQPFYFLHFDVITNLWLNKNSQLVLAQTFNSSINSLIKQNPSLQTLMYFLFKPWSYMSKHTSSFLDIWTPNPSMHFIFRFQWSLQSLFQTY
jgi:hypothetical protein